MIRYAEAVDRRRASTTPRGPNLWSGPLGKRAIRPRRWPSSAAGAADERSESIPQRGRMLLVQVDLVGLSVQTERHRFGSFAAVEVIEQPHFCDLSHLLLSIYDRSEGIQQL